MTKLLSVPPNLVPVFHQLENRDSAQWFVAADPSHGRVGSGGGTIHLLSELWKSKGAPVPFEQWLKTDRRLMIHAGGQSRRLPSYAPSGKILTPIPVFRWALGQRLDQNLLDLQLPLYESLLETTSPCQNTLVASGDVFILAPEIPRELPDVDVLCMGIWVSPELASRHGVFFSPRNDPTKLEMMLQKPSLAQMEDLAGRYLFQMDIGVWILSDRALEVLLKRCGWNSQGQSFLAGVPSNYDLYGTFGPALGARPSQLDPEVSALSVALVPLDGGEFYHFGTSRELVSSMEALQNRVVDQRAIWHARVKPHPSLFVQNAPETVNWRPENRNIWIENAWVGSGWELSANHILTGVPENDWKIILEPGTCLDVVPIDEDLCCLRPYGWNDAFQGNPADERTLWLGRPMLDWFTARNLRPEDAGIEGISDLQRAPLFPILSIDELTQEWVRWMVDPRPSKSSFESRWLASPRLSADEISSRANLVRLYRQRKRFLDQALPRFLAGRQRSVFFKLT